MISLSFTRQECDAIRSVMLREYDAETLDEYDYLILNIIDKIEKELGVE
jgi:hypothetical protein